MTNLEFVEKLKLALNSPTVYVMGGFGAPLDYGNNATRYTTNYDYNKQHASTILKDKHRFAFDCVCLGKGILWGWNADFTRVYGGANYASGGIPDFATGSVPSLCVDYSTDFTKPLVPGEWLYMDGHIGYVLDSETAIECTPAWNNRVQTSQIWNVKKTQSKGRKWLGHGKLKFIEYVDPTPTTCPFWVNGKCTKPDPTPAPTPTPTPTDPIKKGDLVQIVGDYYYNQKTKIPAWVKAKRWYVLQVQSNGRVVIDKSEDGKNSICSPVREQDLKKV